MLLLIGFCVVVGSVSVVLVLVGLVVALSESTSQKMLTVMKCSFILFIQFSILFVLKMCNAVLIYGSAIFVFINASEASTSQQSSFEQSSGI